MTEKVLQFIQKEQLFTPSDKLIIALSGGADSVALLCLLHAHGYHCEAAHCNFRLRESESDRDEAFVRDLCNKLGVQLHTIHFDTRHYAAAHKISIEMAARELRYTWFEQIRLQSKADVIAVAHHQDDSVETFLLNLIRGTGLNGLQGIRAKNGYIVRPLLTVTRQEITAYLQSIGQDYVTDSSNLEDEYTRNKIRLNLLPLLESINPAVRKHIANTSVLLQEVATVYQDAINRQKEQTVDGNRIHIQTLKSQPAPETLLYEVIRPMGFTPSQTHDLFESLDRQSGKIFSSKSGWEIVKDRDCLIVTGPECPNLTPPFRLQKTELTRTDDFIIPRDRQTACFDTDKLPQPLDLRLWKPGDWFIPFGMKGRKLVSDYLTDRKFSLPAKRKQWVLACGEQIVWLVGERTDNRFRIDEHTRHITRFDLIPVSE